MGYYYTTRIATGGILLGCIGDKHRATAQAKERAEYLDSIDFIKNQQSTTNTTVSSECVDARPSASVTKTYIVNQDAGALTSGIDATLTGLGYQVKSAGLTKRSCYSDSVIGPIDLITGQYVYGRDNNQSVLLELTNHSDINSLHCSDEAEAITEEVFQAATIQKVVIK